MPFSLSREQVAPRVGLLNFGAVGDPKVPASLIVTDLETGRKREMLLPQTLRVGGHTGQAPGDRSPQPQPPCGETFTRLVPG